MNQRVNMDISKNLWKQAGIRAIKEGITKKELVEKALKNYLKEGNKMKDYGTVTYKGKTYILTAQADFTGRADLEQYEDNSFELSASAVDIKGKEYIVYWVFVDDKENLDEYDYNKVDRVEESE